MAVVILLPLFLLSPRAGLNASNLPFVLYACVFASIAAPITWMTSIKYLGPSRTAIFFNLVPILTALIAAAVLNETLAGYHLVGGSLTLFWVLLSERWTQPLRHKPITPHVATKEMR